MKVYELAKELGVKSTVLTELLEGTSEKKMVATSVLSEDQIDYINLEMETIKAEEEARIAEEKAKAEAEEKARLEALAKEEEEKSKRAKTDQDFKADEMIPCHSVFPGTLHFTGKATGMTYTFFGSGDRRNVEYQDLKAAMLENAESITKPDIVIDCEELINDEHWWEVKAAYEEMYDENDIKKILTLPTKQFREAFSQLPPTARQTIITMVATQIDNGTFESYNKAKIIDDIAGTEFNLIM